MTENIDIRTSLAISQGATSIASLEALASAEGVPLALDKGNNHVVVLFPPRCCDHHGSRAVPEAATGPYGFDTSEHFITVAGCTLQLAGYRANALTLPVLELRANVLLSYGQIIGLGGDFYGDPAKPVCMAGDQEQQINQFSKNFASLESSADEVKKILQITNQYEFTQIAQRIAKNQAPSGAFVAIPWTKSKTGVMNDEDYDFDVATGGGEGLSGWRFGRYTNLAATNLDHFGEDAMTCYMAGHILAQRRAIDAYKSGNQNHNLKVAYAINAFADHFLTDLFAAGHMRTPRRKLYESAWTDLTRAGAGLCAKRMHDEDNKFGLWVENEQGDKWVAYGDARYRDWCNAASRKVMKAALQQSMNDVWNAFNTGDVVSGDNCKVFKYLPTLITKITHGPTAQQYRDDPRNWAPLFWWNPSDGNYRRNSLSDVSDRTFMAQGTLTGWGISTTVAALQGLTGPYMPEVQYRAAGYPYPPGETGPSGEVGWPMVGATSATQVRGATGPNQVRGATGPTLPPLYWQINGATGPTGPSS